MLCDYIFHEDPEMNIVVATDFSTRSHRALRQAGLLRKPAMRSCTSFMLWTSLKI